MGLSKSNTETLQKTLDFEKILAIAEGAEELSGKMPEALRKVTESEAAAKVRAAKPILAVAKDEAFCFFYRDNLELLVSSTPYVYTEAWQKARASMCVFWIICLRCL